jgi:preprotein translocase subunit YajC
LKNIFWNEKKNERKEEGVLVKKMKVVFYLILIVVIKIFQIFEQERKRGKRRKNVDLVTDKNT